MNLQPMSFEALIQTLKQRVHAMLVERANLAATATNQPSVLWHDTLTTSRYLLNLSPEDFRNIRYHTELVTGELIGHFWHPHPPIVPEEFAHSLGYEDLLSDLPQAYWISEPPTPDLPKPMGVEYRGLLINRTVARHQIAIANLYHARLLHQLQNAPQKQLVVEIGGGFGSLAHHLSNILGKQATCLIVDFPEMFLYQAAFIAVNNPGKSIYIYDRTTFTDEFICQDLLNYDFVLIPNFALEQLRQIQAFALMINMQSFQEMTTAQVEEYVAFGAQRVTYSIYSDNADLHPHNFSGVTSVTSVLEKYLELYPSPTYYDNLFRGTNWRWSRYYKKFFGVPKTSGKLLPTGQMFTMHHANEHGKLERFL